VLYTLYFLAAYLTEGIYWTIHMWMGCVVLAAIAGWLLSFVAVAPANSGEGR
jgi:hypothetical protein